MYTMCLAYAPLTRFSGPQPNKRAKKASRGGAKGKGKGKHSTNFAYALLTHRIDTNATANTVRKRNSARLAAK